jgi:hypothetical protein
VRVYESRETLGLGVVVAWVVLVRWWVFVSSMGNGNAVVEVCTTTEECQDGLACFGTSKQCREKLGCTGVWCCVGVLFELTVIFRVG